MFTELVTTVLDTELCPTSAPFFGFMGVTSALVFASAWTRLARSLGAKHTHAHTHTHTPCQPADRARAGGRAFRG